MNKLLMIAAFSFLIFGCEQRGTRSSELKDCMGLQPNQREDAAKAIKNLTKDQALAVLVKDFSLSPEAAKECVK